MTTFTDKQDKHWEISLDAFAIRRVRQATCTVEECKHRPGIDKECDAVNLTADDGSGFARLANDIVEMIDVLWILLSDQAEGISQEDFAKRLGQGETIEAAVNALVEAGALFFRPSKRKFLETMLKRSEALEKAVTEQAMKKLNDPELEKAVREDMDKIADQVIRESLIRATSARNSQGSVESPPAD